MNLLEIPYEDLSKLPKAQKIELLELLEEREKRSRIKAAQNHFLPFAHELYPGFKEGPHHRTLAKVFEAVMRGEKKRVIINIAPRHSKSESSSYLLPAFFLGKYPEKKIIMATHTAGLSEDYGRRVRNLLQSEEYARLFPETQVAHDQKASGKWSTSKGGQYYAVGVGGALAGRGADLCIDPSTRVMCYAKGWVPAAQVQIGDRLYGAGGWGAVTHRIESESIECTTINNTRMTPNHPVWVEGRGWTPACEVKKGDVLRGLGLAGTAASLLSASAAQARWACTSVQTRIGWLGAQISSLRSRVVPALSLSNVLRGMQSAASHFSARMRAQKARPPLSSTKSFRAPIAARANDARRAALTQGQQTSFVTTSAGFSTTSPQLLIKSIGYVKESGWIVLSVLGLCGFVLFNSAKGSTAIAAKLVQTEDMLSACQERATQTTSTGDAFGPTTRISKHCAKTSTRRTDGDVLNVKGGASFIATTLTTTRTTTPTSTS